MNMRNLAQLAAATVENVTLELTPGEYEVIKASVERYRIAKSAERMLKCQKDTSLYPKYDKLVALIKQTQEKIS